MRTFKKFSFRGVDMDALLDMSTDELVKLFPARARRRFQRGLKRKPMALIKKLRKAEIYEGCLMLFLIRSLEANQFSGPIPPQLGDLLLSSNQLTGNLSVTFISLRNLIDLYVSSNFPVFKPHISICS
ncbi:hypothetical protein GQ457_15G025290 [Hibiscus cannabinus]